MSMKIVNASLLTLALIFMAAGQVAAQAPNTMMYQGRLTDADGAPITTATSVKFEIFDLSSAGSNLYTSTKSITPDMNGVFTVELSNMNTTILNGSKRYMQLTVGVDVLTPRQLITSAPYAYCAQNIANNAVTGAKVANGSLYDIDIYDEPGIAAGYDNSTGAYINLTSTDVNLDSAIIVVPTSGYIVVQAFAYCNPIHTTGTKDYGRFTISRVSGLLDYNYMANAATAANIETGSDIPIPVSLHRVDGVSAGTYRYYFVADAYLGSPRALRPRIVAMFFPTAYGTVNVPAASSEVAQPKSVKIDSASLDGAGLLKDNSNQEK